MLSREPASSQGHHPLAGWWSLGAARSMLLIMMMLFRNERERANILPLCLEAFARMAYSNKTSNCSNLNAAISILQLDREEEKAFQVSRARSFEWCASCWPHWLHIMH